MATQTSITSPKNFNASTPRCSARRGWSDHMRVFGRRSEIEQQPFDPAQAVEGTLSLLSEGLRGKGVDLRLTPLDFTVQVKGYVDQFEQVLINLMVERP